jgi:hypothetical protein
MPICRNGRVSLRGAEETMTHAQNLAAFVARTSHGDLSEDADESLKIRILDSLGCAIGAVRGEPIRMIREHLRDFGGTAHCSLLGGGRTAPDRAALYHGALVRYLDFNDSYLARGESAKSCRTDISPKIVRSLGLERVMFEASDPEVFAWYIKNYGPEVNLFVDHSQIVQLECLRRGIWGTKSLWGRVLTYKG